MRPADMEDTGISMEASQYRIRCGTLNDVDIIAHHRVAMFLDMGSIDESMTEELEEHSRVYLARFMNAGEYLSWLIEADNKIVAGGGIMLRRLLPRPLNLSGGLEAQILNVYTEPEHRRQGLARKVMQAMLDWCAEKGINRISLHASSTGRPLYESLGFNQTNEMRLEI